MKAFRLQIEFTNGNGFMTHQDNYKAGKPFYYFDEDEEPDRETTYDLVVGQMKSYTKTEALPRWQRVSKSKEPLNLYADISELSRRFTVPSPTMVVSDVNQAAGTITLRNGSSIISGLTSTQESINNHARHIMEHSIARSEVERRESQREAERQRLAEERNRPSFLQSIRNHLRR